MEYLYWAIISHISRACEHLLSCWNSPKSWQFVQFYSSLSIYFSRLHMIEQDNLLNRTQQGMNQTTKSKQQQIKKHLFSLFYLLEEMLLQGILQGLDYFPLCLSLKTKIVLSMYYLNNKHTLLIWWVLSAFMEKMLLSTNIQNNLGNNGSDTEYISIR